MGQRVHCRQPADVGARARLGGRGGATQRSRLVPGLPLPHLGRGHGRAQPHQVEAARGVQQLFQGAPAAS
eukprot:9390465-Lingulodinium_polyedra.AAC.1